MKNTPYCICHMMQTIDGKIDSGIDGVEILMDYYDIYTEYEKKIKANSWMFGRRTAEIFTKSVNNKTRRGGVNNGQDSISINDFTHFAIIPDFSGKLNWSNNYINLGNHATKFHLINIVNKSTPEEHLEELKHLGISYVHTNADETLSSALQKIKRIFSIERMILEGGGNLNGHMLKEDLVDEISLLITPLIGNRKSAPSLFDLDSNIINVRNLKLKQFEVKDDGLVWTNYEIISEKL